MGRASQESKEDGEDLPVVLEEISHDIKEEVQDISDTETTQFLPSAPASSQQVKYVDF